jgi:RecB family exonuclease
MPLTTYTGGANSGKTAIAYEALHGALARGLDAALLLPTLPDVERARHELAASAPTSLTCAQFDRYLDERWRLEGDGRDIVTPVQRRAIAVLLLAQWSERAGADPPPGFAKVLERAVAAPRTAGPGAGPEASGRPTGRAARRGTGPKEAAERILLEVSAMYDDRLASLGLIERAAAHLLVTGWESRQDSRALVVHRFTGLSSTQAAYLAAAADAGAEVVVTLSWVSGRTATAALDDLVAFLRRHGELVELDEPSRRFGPQELASVERHLFEAAVPQPADGAVTLVEAAGEEAESLAVVTEVARLLESGLEGHELAVVFRDPSARLPRLEHAMDHAGIVYDVDVPVPLAATPLGGSFAHLLKAAAGTGRESLAAFLRTPHAGVDSAVADRLDASWRTSRVDDPATLVSRLRDAAPDAARLLADARELSGLPLDSRTVIRWADVISRMLANAHGREAPLLEGAGSGDGDAQRRIVSVLQELVGLTGPRSAAMLWDALGTTTVQPKLVERPGHVQVMDAERIRSRRFRGVVLAGLDSGEFPRIGDAGAADATTRLLNGIGVEPPRRADIESERVLFYQVVTRASEHLVLVRRTADAEGTPLRPSVFWEEFLDLYREPREPEERAGQGQQGLPVHRVTRLPVPSSPAAHECEEARRRARSTRGPGRAVAPIDDVGLQREVFSPGELERYAACPYRWFVERVVRSDPLDSDIGPLEMGLLAHDALRRFYAAWLEDGRARVGAGDIEEALEALDAAWAATSRGVAPRDSREREIHARTRASVRGVVRQDAECFSGFSPLHLEWSFGIDDEPEEVDGLLLCGRVDRIDSSAEGVLLMDYKRGPVHAYGRFADLGIVQLPLYAAVVRRRLEQPVVGALYRSLTTLENKGFFVPETLPDAGPGSGAGRVDAGLLDAVIDSAVERARDAVAGIRAGRVEPDPRDEKSCDWCPATSYCEGAQSR